MSETCIFCNIVARIQPCAIVFEDEFSLAFLDKKPLFPGHCLIIPKEHVDTFLDLPKTAIAPFFEKTQLLAKAVELALNAEGSFIAMNNKISQSVPHLHAHIVPRKKQDGLKGFFWPRVSYRDEQHIIEVQTLIKNAVKKIR